MEHLFVKFRNAVLTSTVYDIKSISPDSIIYKRFCKIGVISGIIFFLLNIYYMISNIINIINSQPYACLDLIGDLLLMVTSLFVLFVSLRKQKNYDNILNRVTGLLYYLIIIICVTIFSYTANMRALEINAPLSILGITLSSCYLLLFVISPLPKKADSIIILISMVVGMFILMLIPGKESFDPVKQISFRAVIIVSYIFFYKQNKFFAKNEIEIGVLNDELIKKSYADSLTGALNRNAMNKYLSILQADKTKRKFGVIMFDVDKFKIYNDTYSHIAGDEALKRVCTAIAGVIAELDETYIFRFGGEEFIILTAVSDEKEFIKTAIECRDAVVEENITRDDGTDYPCVTISIGCAIAFNDFQNDGDFITKADYQLYQCKNDGRNCVAFNDVIYR